MKIQEVTTLLNEDRVLSSWISDLTLMKGRTGDVTMTLLNGYRYRISRIGPRIFVAWKYSESKGKFWHRFIKNNYDIRRLM